LPLKRKTLDVHGRRHPLTHLSARPLVDQDIPGAATLAAAVFRFAYASAFDGRSGFDRYVDATFEPQRFAADMSTDSVGALVGHCDGELAGVLKLAATVPPVVIVSPPAVELAKLYVAEEYHGTGIARVILEESLDMAADLGFATMWLCVWEHNPRAQAFYRKAGFEVIGDVVIPMNEVPFRDFLMRRDV
jgi:ribosomal protein S18 acetylase RimI-like enzyme